ncbi:MAG: DUF89 family protein [Oscillospiraceae bacterium]|nr:DUF89 family protein [Oscillospiraceae bacterium]
MEMNLTCLACMLRKNLLEAEKHGDEKSQMAFARGLLQAVLDAPEGVSTPYLSPVIADLFHKHLGVDPDRFQAEKAFSNQFALERLPSVNAKIQQAADPVLAALQYAILGNYIDFSALWGKVDFQELNNRLAEADKIAVDPREYKNFCQELAESKTLLYLTDNAGEIVFDGLLAEAIQARYPQLGITFCVRGGPALNDATRQDAEEVGVSDRFALIDSGCRASGTPPQMIGAELRAALKNSDVILSKGQGNVETLNGCGYNIYYAFLAKCQRFTDRFHVPPLTVMFCNERRFPD